MRVTKRAYSHRKVKAGLNRRYACGEEKLGTHGFPQVLYANISKEEPPFAPHLLSHDR
jgi:hypothetical protein